jgi:hypothetical protein
MPKYERKNCLWSVAVSVRQALKQIVAFVAVNFVDAAKAIGLAVGTDDVTRRQDLQCAAAVVAADFLGEHGELGGERRIGSDQLLGDLETTGTSWPHHRSTANR